jgi:8-amino-7-oxononanoate synthase
VLDFTSAHYLGLAHPSSELASWPALTTGRPAALDPRHGAALAARLARLLQADDAVLARSTLHAGWDVGTVLGGEGTAVLVDDGAYPISEMTALAARHRGSPVVCFAHHDPAALEAAVRATGCRPVVLADGWCPGCGGPVPRRAYQRIAARHRGLLVVDDTQTVGLVRPARPGGALIVASLAKAYGAPLAIVAGGRRLVAELRADGPSRTASSPPTAADLAAAQAALDAEGAGVAAERRSSLWALVHRFRRALVAHGVPVIGAPFPVQPVGPFTPDAAVRLHEGLRRHGVRTVAQVLRCRPQRAAVTFVLTAAHHPFDVDTAVAAVVATLRGGRHGPTP